LCFYLTAIKLGNIATLSSVAITGPLFAGLFECLHQKKWPSKEVLMATFLFICGFYILVGN
ncbi:MAG: EamA family transporter, partial [Pseudobdellovibrionaceae bacterium]